MMSEITVNIPITMLSGATLSDPQSIADTLNKAVEAHATIPALRQARITAIQKVKDIGNYIEQLFDEPLNYERAQKVRQLIIDCKNYGG
jgi:hypothetical protein